jgi:phenylpropionate dioxygenase-like ring-hydroxylating dioxygenase large terminal subunit
MLEEGVQARVHPGLSGRDYFAQDVWELERETVFTNSWFCIGRAEEMPTPGAFLAREVAGERVIALHGTDGAGGPPTPCLARRPKDVT